MGSTVQFWGLGSGLSNTSELIDAMVISETMKIKGYEAKISLAGGKKNAWNDLKSTIDKMNDMIKNLSGVGKQNFKAGTTSSDGFLTADVSNNAANMDYSINVEQLATRHAVSGTKISDINAPLNTVGSFKINGVNIDVTAEDTLSTVMNKINSTKDADGNKTGAKAYIIDGTLIVESEKSGVDNQLKFEDSNGILKNIGLIKDDGSMNTTKIAQNAIIKVNDIVIERASNTIDDAISGVTLNLTKVTTDDITLKVGNDSSNLKTMITDFINTYNELITKTSKYTSFDAEAGTSGLLNGDSSVGSLKSSMSETMQSSFSEGEFSYLFDIGISIDKYGKYQIDEKKLDSALEKNSGDVVNMFTKGLENPTSKPDSSNGLFVRMKATLNELVGGTSNLFSAKSTSLDAQVKSYNDLITRQQSYIDKRRKTLEAQFAALEATMSSINSTSGLLTQMGNASNNNNK